MRTVGLKELRQNASELVREVEAGGEVTITVSGRPSVRMVPATPRTWRKPEDLASLFSSRGDDAWNADRDLVAQQILDPWEREDTAPAGGASA